MSFLSEITGFSKSRLQSVSTEITTVDGRKIKETRDKYGRSHFENVGCGELGFVGDVKPDLQVGRFLDDHLLLGSQDVAADFDLLMQMNVTHVINIASLVENFFPEEFLYLRIDVLDLPETDILQHFTACFNFIKMALKNGGTCFVHCNAGVSRSASIVIGFLMMQDNRTYEEVRRIVKEARPSIRPNEGFVKQLKEYEQTLKIDGT